MPATRVAAQLYTLREFLKTPAEIRASLPRVAAAGYRAVQLSALGPIDARELQAILEDAGLEVCATHQSFERLRDDLDTVAEEHALLGCRHIALPVTPAAYRSGEGYGRFAREASALGRRMRYRGLLLSYHNHSFELERYDGRSGLEILLAESDPEALHFELDTYWIQHGGGDPCAWIRRAAGRCPLLHLKDMAISASQQVMAEVGEGNMNWPGILDAARDAGVEWYIVEQDVCRRDPFESLAISLRNLKAMGLD